MADLFGQRNPLEDPLPGDLWWNNRFAGGVHLTVHRRFIRKTGGQMVRVRLNAGPGRHVRCPTRVWSLPTFAEVNHKDGRLMLVGERR